MRRGGFTLVEMMIATGIFAIIIGGVFGAFIGICSLTRATLAESEHSVRMRELREKLLFHAAPPHDGKYWSGLLSGTRLIGEVVENGTKIVMDACWGYAMFPSDHSSDEPVAQRIELVQAEKSFADGEKVRILVNDGDRIDDQWTTKWLVPGNVSFLPENGLLDTTSLNSGYNVFYVNLESSVWDPARRERTVTRRERVTVPVFGRVQRTMTATKVFDD